MLRLCVVTGVLLLLGGVAVAQTPQEPTVTPPTWGDDSTFEFGIYDNGNRVATAYYRILKEKDQDRDIYRFKYVGRNPQISEATECVVDAHDLRPLRSTRKVVYSEKDAKGVPHEKTFFQDSGYREGGVLLRKRYEGQATAERPIGAHSNPYDYEELLWLIPQLDIPDNGKVRFELFSMLTESVSTVIVSQAGMEDIQVAGKTYTSRVYTFDVGITQYKYWMVMQSGRGTPARIDMASTRFENLKLDPKKVTKFPKYEAQAAPATTSNGDQNQPPPANDISPYVPPPPSGG
jgi:hypothetical protein